MTLQSSTAKDADTLDENQGAVDTENRVSRRRSIQSRMLSLFRRSPGVVVAGSIAVLFALRTFSLRRWAVIWQHRWRMPSCRECIGLSC